jgi:maltokinase
MSGPGTPPAGGEVLAEPTVSELSQAVSAWAGRRHGWGGEPAPATVLDAVRLRRGRPGLIDVVAEVTSRIVHVPIGVRAPADHVRLLTDGEEVVLGTVDDGDGVAMAFDALRDSETAALLLAHVAGARVEPALVRQLRMDDASVTMAMEDRFSFTVYHDVSVGTRPEVDVLYALDEAGFNHVAAPLSRWRRGPWDLGVVQELLAGPASGRALALTSVRDLYVSGGPPDMAGGDFGAEAHRLGTMAARMHLALERGFGRRSAGLELWADAVHGALAARRPQQAERPDVVSLLEELHRLPATCDAIRTHGDFGLGRTWRTEQGWYVGDLAPGGWPPPAAEGPPPPFIEDGGIAYRTPLADVADMMWSLADVAVSAAGERDPRGAEGLAELADAWEQRNRRSFLAGYLGVPGIGTLVPSSRDAVRLLVRALELERASRA